MNEIFQTNQNTGKLERALKGIIQPDLRGVLVYIYHVNALFKDI